MGGVKRRLSYSAALHTAPAKRRKISQTKNRVATPAKLKARKKVDKPVKKVTKAANQCKGSKAKLKSRSKDDRPTTPKINKNTARSKAISAAATKGNNGAAKPKVTSNGSGAQATGKIPVKNKTGELEFDDWEDFRPNISPKEVLQNGSFGGTYFRPIYSGVTKKKYSGVWKELPKDWLEGLDIEKQVASSKYDNKVNTYKVKCGGSLEMWETSGWMDAQDPYGWFMWYCRFYQGRRTDDDERQVGRWRKCAGTKGRWRNNLITKCVRSASAYDDTSVSPVVRQTLQHWGYKLTKAHYDAYAKNVLI